MLCVFQAVKTFSRAALLKKKEFRREGGRVVRTTALDKVKRELAIMKKVAHPNVVGCYEIIDDEEHDELYMSKLCAAHVAPAVGSSKSP